MILYNHSYDGFAERIKGKQFSLISIDGPWGSERHSRRDIVDLLPDILEKDWAIIMDDTERPGERETIAEIESVLKKNAIEYHKGFYSGIKGCCVLASNDNKFLCSMRRKG